MPQLIRKWFNPPTLKGARWIKNSFICSSGSAMVDILPQPYLRSRKPKSLYFECEDLKHQYLLAFRISVWTYWKRNIGKYLGRRWLICERTSYPKIILKITFFVAYLEAFKGRARGTKALAFLYIDQLLFC
jgi:hypothetical protein